MTQTRYVDAVNDAIREEMRRDQRVFVMAEDAQVSPFGFTKNLVDEFGPERVRNTPICEGTMAGTAVGAAAAGVRPLVDFQLASFSFLAFDQFVNQASMLRYLTGGQVKLPIVYFLRFGARGSMAAQHSHSIHSMLMNVPGLKIVMPSTPYDAKGMMKTAIRDDNPVLFFAHGALSRTAGEVPEEDYTVPFGSAKIVRQGSDVTVVAMGTMLQKAQTVADEYAKYSIGVEIIDPRSLVPLDKETILNSVAKTGRLVVVDEAHQTCSAASEICAVVAEEAFDSLKAPVRRVCSLDVPIPYSPPLEDFVLPDERRISKAIESILE